MLKCCLVRTPYSYRGVPTREGGSQLEPDLAASLPKVSPDGLTWTIALKPGLHYAPPFQNTVITAADIERAVKRTLRVPKPGGVFTSQGIQWRARQANYRVIVGVDEYLSGRADSISGLEVVDARTLRIHLLAQAGDLATRLAGPDAAPMPPGAEVGHLTDYARFLVASGPYMVEGSERLDFSKPPDQQRPLSGFRPGGADPPPAGTPPQLSLVLVRNPSWQPASDTLRPAYADRIEVRTVADEHDAARMVDTGEADLVSSANPSPQIPLDQLRRYSSTPALAARLKISRRDFVRTIIMNVAVRPFDDVHVRKAVNWSLDKKALQLAAGGPLVSDIAGHVLSNGFVRGLLNGYNPYPTTEGSGDLVAARREMALSRYDRDHDGRCDDPSCRALKALTFSTEYFPAQARIVATDLARIGIDLAVEELPRRTDALFARLANPRGRVPLALPVGFARSGAFPNAAAMMSLFSSPDPTYNTDHSMLGADAHQLAAWGYQVRSVPSIDLDIQACRRIVGSRQEGCWAALDERLTESVVPWAPYAYENDVRVISPRVSHYSFDQSGGMPALDRIALRPGVQ